MIGFVYGFVFEKINKKCIEFRKQPTGKRKNINTRMIDIQYLNLKEMY